jgi:hypothetical protein
MSADAFDHAKPWERQPCDTARSYVLFSEWLTMAAPRRISDLAKGRGDRFDIREVESFAREHAWKDRAELYDRWIASLKLETIATTVQEKAKRHAQAAFRAFRFSSNELRKLEAQSFAPGDFPVLKPHEALAWLETSIGLERDAAGLVGEERKGPDLSKLSYDEVKQFRELWLKAT